MLPLLACLSTSFDALSFLALSLLPWIFSFKHLLVLSELPAARGYLLTCMPVQPWRVLDQEGDSKVFGLGWNRQFEFFPAIFCLGKCDPCLGQHCLSPQDFSITNSYSTTSLCVGQSWEQSMHKNWWFLAATEIADTPKAPSKQNPECGDGGQSWIQLFEALQ